MTRTPVEPGDKPVGSALAECLLSFKGGGWVGDLDAMRADEAEDLG